MLDWATTLPARCNVEKTKTVRTEQPFVAGHRDKIGIDALHIEGQSADRLGCIYAQHGADAPTCSPDCLEVDEPAVRPMTMRDSDDSGRCLYGGEQRRSPIVVAWPRHRDGRRAGSLRDIHPRIDVGWKLLGQRHNGLRLPDGNIVRCLRHAVGDRRSEGDIVALGIDEACKQFSHRLARGEEIGRSDAPRLGFAPQPSLTCSKRGFRQRR